MTKPSILTEDEIKKMEWLRFYSGNFCFLTLALWGELYVHEWKKTLGKGLHTFILISHKEKGTAFFEKNDYKSLGTYLAKKATHDPNYGYAFATELKKQINVIYSVMDSLKNVTSEKEVFYAFAKALANYSPWHSCIKIMMDYLPDNLREELLPTITEARILSEKVYGDTELFLTKIAEKISVKTGYDKHLILAMLPSEIHSYFISTKLPDPEILEKRYESSALIWTNDKFEVVSGNEVRNIEKALFDTENKTSVQGQIAYKGKINGTAKIVLDPNKADHFNDGDILITTMTRPEYLSLIKRSSALVTDGGGILCHAAIIAREIKKPSIIGTEIATQIFQNGDLVEVDADNGVVRKL